MLGEHRFGHDGTRTAGTESGDRRQEMDEQDVQVAHVISLPRRNTPLIDMLARLGVGVRLVVKPTRTRKVA